MRICDGSSQHVGGWRSTTSFGGSVDPTGEACSRFRIGEWVDAVDVDGGRSPKTELPGLIVGGHEPVGQGEREFFGEIPEDCVGRLPVGTVIEVEQCDFHAPERKARTMVEGQEVFSVAC